jgi:hypothetical protein
MNEAKEIKETVLLAGLTQPRDALTMVQVMFILRHLILNKDSPSISEILHSHRYFIIYLSLPLSLSINNFKVTPLKNN